MNVITDGTFNGLDIVSIIKVIAKRNKFPMWLEYSPENQTMKYALLTLNNKAIGFYIWTYPNYNTIGSLLQYLLIDEKYQNQGYGSHLINHYFDWCKTNNRPKSMVQIIKPSLQVYYEKFGYTFDNIDDRVISMTKTICP